MCLKSIEKGKVKGQAQGFLQWGGHAPGLASDYGDRNPHQHPSPSRATIRVPGRGKQPVHAPGRWWREPIAAERSLLTTELEKATKGDPRSSSTRRRSYRPDLEGDKAIVFNGGQLNRGGTRRPECAACQRRHTIDGLACLWTRRDRLLAKYKVLWSARRTAVRNLHGAYCKDINTEAPALRGYRKKMICRVIPLPGELGTRAAIKTWAPAAIGVIGESQRPAACPGEGHRQAGDAISHEGRGRSAGARPTLPRRRDPAMNACVRGRRT